MFRIDKQNSREQSKTPEEIRSLLAPGVIAGNRLLRCSDYAIIEICALVSLINIALDFLLFCLPCCYIHHDLGETSPIELGRSDEAAAVAVPPPPPPPPPFCACFDPSFRVSFA